MNVDMKKVIYLAVLCIAGPGLEGRADTASHGDSFLYLGESGYAYLEDAYLTDLDYVLDFSVEVVARIEPHQAGGRGATFIEKGGDLHRLVSSPGFAVGTYEGNSEAFATPVAAKISDGVNYLWMESPRAYQGYVHIVLVWEAGPRTMTLYVNGQSIGSGSDPLLSPAAIRNDGELAIGRGERELRRNIFLARLWNRKLSASETGSIWAAFSESRRHTLPETFDRSGLLSEWLMDRTCDIGGDSGIVRLRDNVGYNHLWLAGNARLIRGAGPLTAAYPPDEANDVAKSVVLRASGGRAHLGGAPTGPLHYHFEIDQSPAFNTPACRQSGWIAHDGQWKPILEPDTVYYWRVKVRDSGTPPAESAFTQVRRFSTKGPSTWYVRPLVDLDDAVDELGNAVADEGVYGRQDGTSYENAFNGIAHIRWGENGVEAGDTLYLCDTHVYEVRNGYWVPPVVGYIKESGFSCDCPITIRMDCPQRPGTLCGFSRDLRSSIPWVGPDANGVYHTNGMPTGAAVEFDGRNYHWLDREIETTWAGHPGAVCNVPRQDESWIIDTAHVKMSDGGSPDGRIYGPNGGFEFDLGRSSYVRFLNCNFFSSPVAMNGNATTDSEQPPSHHIVFEGCDIGYKPATLVNLTEGMNDWTIRDCNVHDGENGIITSTPGHLYNLLVDHCRIYSIGAPNFPNRDAHALGVQNGAGHIFQHNHIWNIAGSAVEFWSGVYTMQNMTVRYNFIHDTLGTADTSASGIVISGDEDATPGKRTGFKIHNNIIMNTAGDGSSWRGYGISSNSMDSIEIYNNILCHTYHGIRLVTTNPEPGFPVKARVYNNIIVSPQDIYAFVDGASQPWNELYWDHNLYSPAADVESRLVFTQTVVRDRHSVLADPRFVAAQPARPEDFELRADSPAIDAGIDVNVAEDFSGDFVPQGAAPDIGAFEYHP
jgi:hypothetical protein